MSTQTATPAAVVPAAAVPAAVLPATVLPATAAETAVPAETGARTDEAVALITGARSRIDDLDTRIIGLVMERMAVSSEIQRARIASGGRRVNLSREMEILNHFSDELGKPGTTLAMTLLELCRGRV
ncbi:chorismate mutase [Streptomyces sp. H10-C2]|uniref:chorismate mutase n=1 Tax=unclassified Streptomyces TaxID=2593676 RepID=UPI0024B9E8BE|nr:MULTISPECIES: chorismate mutase [unclassified Streptomyces]MDJ0340582.1 chorismate mutase [Streptomyces sp. PH10-H1]MDJ0370230.1 chorismate mutase [Streptomyces sp. H10-C2]